MPVKVEGLEGLNVKQVSCGRNHTLCVTEDGNVFAWGDGYEGALGLGSKNSHKHPVHISGLEVLCLCTMFYLLQHANLQYLTNRPQLLLFPAEAASLLP